MTDFTYGKPIDVQKLKKPVLTGLKNHLDQITSMVEYLAQNETPVPQSACYVCGSRGQSPFSSIHGFQYVQCSDCSHVYTTSRYDEEALRRFYEKNRYYSEVTYANKETCDYRRENVARPKVEFVEKYTNGNHGIWIDVGSGIGDVPSVLIEKGWNAIGLELSENSVRFAKEVFNVPLIRQTFQEYCKERPDLLGKAAVVSLIGIIEHVTKPLELLGHANRLLEPKGLVMIQVPNALSFASLVQKVYPENVFRHMNPMDHIMLYTKESLDKALGLSGFSPIAYWFHGLDIYELLNSLILTNERVQNSELSQTFYKLMNELQLVIDKNELSNSIICVARKVLNQKR